MDCGEKSPITRPVRKPVAGWPDVIALYRELAQYGVETARKLNRRLQWQAGLALKLGALVVATLSIVALITPPEDDASEQTAVLARHSALSGSPPAQPAAMGDMGALNPDTARRQADGQDTESRQIAVAQQRARESLDAAVNTGVPADVTTRQALTGVTAANTPASDSVSKESESPVSTWISATAIADVQPKPLDVNDDQVRMSLSGNQAGAELARDAALQDEATVANGSVAEAGAASPKKIELAALKSVEPPPLAEQAPSQQTSVDDDVMPPTVSAQQKINELLSLGRQALSEDRLLIPPNNSAYDYYHQVLRLEPGNADASEGIEQIVQRYTLFARRALDREDEKKARQYIMRGLRVRPGDRQLLVLQERMNDWLARLELEAMSIAESRPSPVTEQPSPQPQNFLSRLKAFFSRVQHENQETDLWEE